MADRAAPMSSEEEALQSVWHASWSLGRAKAKYDADHDGSLATVAPFRYALEAALDNYKEHIERRVLAQQPCYRMWKNPAGRGNCIATFRSVRCPTCQARAAQTQETSALPPTDTPDAKKSQA